MVSLLSPKAKVLRRCFVSLLILCLICVSETASSQPDPTAASSSLGAITIAQTQQTDAPALAFSGGQLIATWIGSDDRGVHQDARTIIDQQLSDVVTLPLPPTHPYGQQLFPGDLTDATTHLLWLDADQNQQTTLYSALLTPDLSVERGPVSISEGLALASKARVDWLSWLERSTPFAPGNTGAKSLASVGSRKAKFASPRITVVSPPGWGWSTTV